MSMEINCKTEFETDKESLTVGELEHWLEHLPSEAKVQPILRDYGSQRDPDERLVGIKATWTETR